jgi:hypothetical protein
MAEIEMSFNDYGGDPILHEDSHVKADMNPFKAHQAEDDDVASVASDEDDDHPIPVADEKGHLAHYPGEEEHQKHHHKVRLSSTLCVHGESDYCMASY